MRTRQLSSHRRAQLAEWARLHRHAPTPSEQRLWLVLRAANLAAGFRRQVVIGEFIADLAAPRAKLVVEVDGAWHARRRRADARRDRVLEHAGYRVLRFTAVEVLHELPSVLERIRVEIARRL